MTGEFSVVEVESSPSEDRGTGSNVSDMSPLTSIKILSKTT